MVLFKKEELSLLWPFYLDAFISSIFLFMPVFIVVYFRDLGLSLFQISFLTTMMLLFTILFEIPTGAFADLYGRKTSVLLGSLIQGVSMLAIFFLRSYPALLVAFSFIGIGSTFNSGAREAWVTYFLNKKNKNLLHSYFAKADSIRSTGIVLSGALGALLVRHFGVSIIWIASGASFFITLILLTFAKEHFLRREVKLKESFSSLKNQSITSLKYVRANPVLFPFLIAISIFVFAGIFNGDMSWVTLLQELNLPVHYFGYMWSAMGIIGIFAPLISLKLMKQSKEKKFILIAILLTALSTSMIIFAKTIISALLVLLFSLFFISMSSAAERVYFHRFLSSKLRATIGSIESMLMGIIGVIALPLTGLSIDLIGARNTIFLSAFLMLPSLIIFLKIKEAK